MKKPWYKKDSERYAREKKKVGKRYPELHFHEEEAFVLVRGTFPVLGGDGRVLDRYEVEIHVPSEYPIDLPVVYEVGGDIPRRADRHINNIKGECCLETEEDFWIRHGPDYHLVDFLDGPVRSFFADQSYFDLTGEWPHGERPHGVEGIFESYEEILGTNDRREVCRWVYLLTQQEVNVQWHCPCGSGNPIEECHAEQTTYLRNQIPPAIARRSLRRLARHPDFSLIW